jgi:hypothetical protein
MRQRQGGNYAEYWNKQINACPLTKKTQARDTRGADNAGRHKRAQGPSQCGCKIVAIEPRAKPKHMPHGMP